MKRTRLLLLLSCLLLCCHDTAVYGSTAEEGKETMEVSRFGGVYTDLADIFMEVQEEVEEAERLREQEIEEAIQRELRLQAMRAAYEEEQEPESEPEEPEVSLTDVKNVPSYNGMKSWMSYGGFGKSTRQQQLQYMAITEPDGFRTVEGRFCVALGSYFTVEIGQWFDLVLENGTVIPCVLGDGKADQHTDSSNIFTVANQCCSEFIVDTGAIPKEVKSRGNCSYRCDEWQSPVTQVILYDKNSLT